MSGSAESGWVLLSAGIIDSPIFRGPADMFRLWVLLLCKAHRRQEPFRLMGGKEIHRGELVTSMADLQQGLLREGTPQAGESGAISVSRQTIQRYLDAMVRDGMVERQSTRKGTWIKILNFDTYQSFDTYRATRADTNTDTRADRQADTSGQQKGQPNCGCATRTGLASEQVNGHESGQASGHERTRVEHKRTRAATNDSDTPSTPNTHTQDARADLVDLPERIIMEFKGAFTNRYIHPPKMDDDHVRDRARAKSIIDHIQKRAQAVGEEYDAEQVLDAWRYAAYSAVRILPKSKSRSLAYISSSLDDWLDYQDPEEVAVP